MIYMTLTLWACVSLRDKGMGEILARVVRFDDDGIMSF